jgi:3-oxoacyl-[acyl-carrier-protein] synthase-3
MGTDGTGHKHLLIPAGASRNPATVETLQRVECADGIWRTGHEGRMNGAEVFAFTLREVPGLFKKVLEAAGWSVEAMDAFVPHQANLFMLEHLRKRMKIPVEKQILALDEFGNTSSASVPLALTTRLRDQLSAGAKNLVLAGFGVGWSWGAAAVTAGPLCMPELVEVAEPHAP